MFFRIQYKKSLQEMREKKTEGNVRLVYRTACGQPDNILSIIRFS